VKYLFAEEHTLCELEPGKASISGAQLSKEETMSAVCLMEMTHEELTN